MTERSAGVPGAGSLAGSWRPGAHGPVGLPDSPGPFGPNGPYGVRGEYWRPRTALVVPVPAADTVVDRHRWRMDPSAARGLAAHVGLVSPFVTPDAITPTLARALREAFGDVAAFTATFDQVRWFEESGDEAVWLAPVPEEPFVELMRRARGAVDLPRDDAPPVPHLIVGYRRHASFDELRIAAHQLGPQLPVRGRVDRVALVATDGAATRWNTLDCFPLAGRR